MSHKVTTYSSAELEEFSKIIAEKIAETKKNRDFLNSQLQGNNHGTDDTSYAFNVMDSSQLSSTQDNLAMQITRENKFLDALILAEQRIKNKTYGICRVTGKLIPKERLMLVPHATLSIEGKELLEKGNIS